jgi:hypothetical protein
MFQTDVEKDKVVFLDDIMDAETIERLRGEGQETLEGGKSSSSLLLLSPVSFCCALE